MEVILQISRVSWLNWEQRWFERGEFTSSETKLYDDLVPIVAGSANLSQNDASHTKLMMKDKKLHDYM